MYKFRVFISSVQNEIAGERQMLFEFLQTDELLYRFFEPIMFERFPASGTSPVQAYLEKIKICDIYIGLFGHEYGYEDAEGVSPTEREFDLACAESKVRLIFIKNGNPAERHPKTQLLIRKAEQSVVRKSFSSLIELRSSVYASLINFLEVKELIRSGPFDAAICKTASIEDIDPERLKWFIQSAQAKRGFPLSPTADTEVVLTHLNLIRTGLITNAALLLFGREPQRFFITAEIRCVMFHGVEMIKPIRSYQVYKGDVFQQVNQAVDFVLSRIDVSVGARDSGVEAAVQYEIPRMAVTEAIVNAVAHRDYTSHGSIQVMLFRDRLEIWNPGRLPFELPISQIKKPHSSFPANPLLAEPMYLAGYIERLGTGIPDMIKACNTLGLKEPVFKQEETFRTIIWRKEQVLDVSGEVTGEVTGEVFEAIRRLVFVLNGELRRADLQNFLQLRHEDYFRMNYINPSIEEGYIEMTIPDSPTSSSQRYRLTQKGIDLRKIIDPSFTPQATPQATPQPIPQVTPQVTPQDIPPDKFVIRLVKVLEGTKNREQIQELIGLKDRKSFVSKYLNPSLDQGLVEMILPDTPTSPKQKYYLTEKGKAIQRQLKKQKSKK